MHTAEGTEPSAAHAPSVISAVRTRTYSRTFLLGIFQIMSNNSVPQQVTLSNNVGIVVKNYGYGPFQQPFYVDTFATIDTRITRLFIGPYPQPSKNTRWAQSGSLGPAPYTPCRGSRAFCRRRRSRALPCYSRHRISTPRLDASSTPTTRAPIVIPYYQTRYELIWEPRAGVLAHPLAPLGVVFHCCFKPQWHPDQPSTWRSPLLAPTKMVKAAESMIWLSTYLKPAAAKQ